MTSPDERPQTSARRLSPSAKFALGVVGFFGFYFVVLGLVAGATLGGRGILILECVVVLAFVLWLWQSWSSDTRAVLAPMAVGFAVAFVLFGGCIALLSSGRLGRIAG
jgi:hypothetical protein